MKKHFPTIFLGVVTTLFIMVISIMPTDQTRFYAVFFDPSIDSAHALTHIIKKNARLVRKGGFDNIYIVYSEEKDFATKVKNDHVVFTSSALVAGGCFYTNENTRLTEAKKYGRDI